MSRTIITGIDGSPTASDAARTAAILADALDAELHLVSAYGRHEVGRVTAGNEEFVFTNEDDATSTLDRVLMELRTKFPGLTIKQTASEGKPAEALVRAAERLNADLIVVGNKRVQGISRVLGSVAKDVAQKAPCDLYIAQTHRKL